MVGRFADLLPANAYSRGVAMRFHLPQSA